MEKSKLVSAIFLAGILLANLAFWYRMDGQIHDLKQQVASMQPGATTFDLYNMKEELLQQMKYEESILSSQDISLDIVEGKVHSTVTIVPKEWNINEKVFITIGDRKQEAMSTTETSFESTFSFDVPMPIRPIVSFETDQAVRQEALQEAPLSDILRLHVDSTWIEKDYKSEGPSRLQFHLYSQLEESQFLLKDEPTVKCLLVEETTENKLTSKLQVESKGREGKMWVYELIMEETDELEGYYHVQLTVESSAGLSFKSAGPIAGIVLNKEEFGSHYMETGTMELYPAW
ncbi:hypothetical protein J0B03_11585 [Alkalibacter rhizosphaerae]|uniref:Uncharacterized protein n=1 Tax=Alkalibacter rhizosphaerae TaxID=2815577 RepID=A0A974XGR5_9FIRM|nr:hypothetical protein [Alkalibacter rhizosphaerae]QSX08415.1 hypothetical protein J0B03_11585 [Alkalibacter rhizosphaerae]